MFEGKSIHRTLDLALVRVCFKRIYDFLFEKSRLKLSLHAYLEEHKYLYLFCRLTIPLRHQVLQEFVISYIVSREAIYSSGFIAFGKQTEYECILICSTLSLSLCLSFYRTSNLQIIKVDKAPRGNATCSDCIQNRIVLRED